MNKKIIGLTLIEVLIALAIISIALTAIIKATSQSLKSDAYLEDKTIAMWVGQQAINEARIRLLIPANKAELKKTTMLGEDWYWILTVEDTPNEKIKKILVRVYKSEDTEQTPLITLESYVYNAE